MPKRKEAVTIVVLDTRTGLMLATHRKEDISQWGMPGGKIDENESPLEAIVREFSEETPYNVLINNLEYLGVYPCYGPTDYNVHTYMVKDASMLKINLSLKNVEQNYGWIHPRLLTVGPFAYFNKTLFAKHKDKIFGKLYPFIDWTTGMPEEVKTGCSTLLDHHGV